MTKSYWCPAALTDHGWRDAVRIDIDGDGWIERVDRDDTSRADAVERLAGAVIPGISNLHSHAHQRAMAGLAECTACGEDDFWSWREAMYRHVGRIGPQHLHAIARQLYVEMLKAGYTSVAEFQYLHHDLAGRPYANPAEMTLQCLHGAREAGIGFTALPVLYRHGGFGEQPTGDAQRRFFNDADGFLAIVESLADAVAPDPNAALGIAPHSLRAVSPALLDGVLSACRERAEVFHIHVAEQLREVDECLAWSGQRPVEWLLDHVAIDQRWCLIHATHMNTDETARLAASGAVAGLCPTTEANLGDGLFNASPFSGAGGAWGIGSDSQISVSPVEELRWLEYGVRLSTRSRNPLAGPASPHSGQLLLDAALAGGARACGRRIGAIAPGHRADFIVLDADHPRLYGRSHEALIDSWIFSGNDNPVRDVIVGGRKVIDHGHHAREEEIARDYKRAIDDLSR